MNAAKKILFPLISLFLLYRSFELIRRLVLSEVNDFSTGETTIIGVLISIYVTGGFEITGFAYPTRKILPDTY